MRKIIIVLMLGIGILSYAKGNSKELIDAVLNNNIERVKELLDEGVSPNTYFNDPYEHPFKGHISIRTPLLAKAIELKYNDIARMMIEYGANVNLKDSYGGTALFNAADNNDLEMVKLLLQHKASVNISVGESGISPLITAKDIEIKKLLIEHGADVNDRRNIYRAAEISGAVVENKIEYLSYLLEHGANPNNRNIYGVTPIMGVRSVEAAELLLRHGAKIDAKDTGGGTALETMLAENRKEIAKYLIEQGADVNSIDKNKDPTIFCVKDVDMLKLMIEYGADWQKKQDDGTTLLIYNSDYGNFELVKYLVGLGMDVNAVDNYGNTALIYACDNAHIDIVKYLMSQGADVNKINKFKHTALSRIRMDLNDKQSLHKVDKSALKEIEQLLLEAGAK